MQTFSPQRRTRTELANSAPWHRFGRPPSLSRGLARQNVARCSSLEGDGELDGRDGHCAQREGEGLAQTQGCHTTRIMVRSQPPRPRHPKPRFFRGRAWVNQPPGVPQRRRVYHSSGYTQRGFQGGAECLRDHSSSASPREGLCARQRAPPARDWGVSAADTLPAPCSREHRGFRQPWVGPGPLVKIEVLSAL